MSDEHPPESRDEMWNGSKWIPVLLAVLGIAVSSGLLQWGITAKEGELERQIHGIAASQGAIVNQLTELQKAMAEQAREFAAFQGGYVQRRDNDDERYRGLSEDVKVLNLKIQKLERDLAVLMERRP